MRAARLLFRVLLTAALLAVLGAAGALVFSPGLVAPLEPALAPVSELLEEVGTERLLLLGVALIGAVATLVVAIRTFAGGDDPPELVGGDERPPEATSVDPATVSGHVTDRTIAEVGSLAEARELRGDLRAVAVEALRTAGEEPRAARDRIDRGEWTDDDLAAGFLGDATPVPLLARLRGWLDGATEGRRRLRRSADAVAALAAAPDRARDRAEGDDE